MKSYDLIVVGSGLAGLHAAQLGASFGDVLLLTKARLEDCNTTYAQGGIAAAWTEVDTPEVHFRDTMAAGDGLCNPEAVRILVEEGPRRVHELVELGVPFDRVDGQIIVTREAAHTNPRILHAGGDATGARIERTVAGSVLTTSRIDVRENCFVTDLVLNNGRVTGVKAIVDPESGIEEFAAGAVILATGGAGQLYAHTTNPTVATGDGIALAFRAGAAIADMEFVQFHPTALLLAGAPRFLISEALRGEGGVLRNANGERFMPRYTERGELAPRDVVARSIAFETMRTGTSSAFLDVRHLGADHVRRRFPTIARVCAEFGIDIGSQPIPVAPAAHYLMGGILTNSWGQTSLPGLYACGECACSSVHGANRLASNSLLEAIVFSDRAVRHHFSHLADSAKADQSEGLVDFVANHAGREGDLPSQEVMITPDPSRSDRSVTAPLLREMMWSRAGLIRDDAGLADLVSAIDRWKLPTETLSAEDIELTNLVTLSRLVATAATLRTESRGAHYRTDYPSSISDWQRHIVLRTSNPRHSQVGGPR